VTVQNAWVRATVGTSRPTAGYAEITNSGSQDDELLSVSTSAAMMTELHRSTVENGVMKMEPVSNLAVPAGKTVKLEPGAYHLMIMQVMKSLKEGDTVDLVFTFKFQGPVKVAAKVLPLSAEHMP
jgi:copper(I)-binding protein